MRLKVALAQMRCPKGDWEGNLARTGEYMGRTAAEGCNIAVFPEMGLSGYCDPGRFPESVQSLDSPYITEFAGLSARYGIAASGGFIERNPGGKPFITQVVAIDGEIVAVYRKVHVVDEEAEWFSPGEGITVFDLPLPGGAVRCGLAVCADSDRPALFEAMAREGARVVFHSSAPGLYGRRTDEDSWRAGYEWYRSHLSERLPIYAAQNNLYICVATQTGQTVDEDFPGGSFVFGPDGTCLASTPDWGEALLVSELNVPALDGRVSTPI